MLITAQLKSFPAIDSKIIDIFKAAIRDAKFTVYDSTVSDDDRITELIADKLYPLLERPVENTQKSDTDQATVLIRFILPNGLGNAHKLFFDQKADSLNDTLIKLQIAPLSKFNGDAKSARNFADSYLSSLTQRITTDKNLLNSVKAFAVTGQKTAIDTINRYLTAAVLWEIERAVNSPNDPYDLAFDIVESFKKDKYSKSLMQTALYKEALQHTAKNFLEQLSQALTKLR